MHHLKRPQRSAEEDDRRTREAVGRTVDLKPDPTPSYIADPEVPKIAPLGDAKEVEAT